MFNWISNTTENLTRSNAWPKMYDHWRHAIWCLCVSISAVVLLSLVPSNVCGTRIDQCIRIVLEEWQKMLWLTFWHHYQLFPVRVSTHRERMCVHWHWKNLRSLMILKVRTDVNGICWAQLSVDLFCAFRMSVFVCMVVNIERTET